MATGFVVAPCPGFHRLKLSVNRKHSRGFCEQPLAELTSSKDGTKQQHRSMRMPRRTFGVSAALIIGSAATFSFRSSQANAQEEELCLAEEKGICKPTASQGSVQLSILGSGFLSVGRYPSFSYDASGSGGVGQFNVTSDGKRAEIFFPGSSLKIPALSFSNTRFLGIPLPPFLKIVITPKDSRGFIDFDTGLANMDFDAIFQLFVADTIPFVPISVVTKLTTDTSSGIFQTSTGERLSSSGVGRLAGVAPVPKTGDGVMDTFLGLPTDTVASLPVSFSFLD
mmetsp:Transcript_5927/g.9095  ORF Transcript_5927/g.9095 Transcript_5927/m.9095 type:complete len:282 (-) Transcript_5927:107-952(-)|eukprot:CAMPEP_0184343716 /NCGR_PEP_ID=MMETSP1089-20130417/12211_1 /TAXON_ID=38269 ORGANISM="Gloeochaete wittrockiana, Strain SAG46.84" /NCGR_SAMPLE_ID=MMETSP1089 /ASSEMBLY_ACC=CAM_ASM_000445 /LENGTH=281 /DNA_ID=CAMNT_0026673131 /DNA_START=11 /DNA_END=856 /DNA_ORIENTATION=-